MLSWGKAEEFIKKIINDDKLYERRFLENKRQLEINYDNLHSYIFAREEELRDEIKKTKEKIVEELTRLQVATKNIRSDIEREELSELRKKAVELSVMLEDAKNNVEIIKRDRNFWGKLAIVSLTLMAFLVGTAVGVGATLLYLSKAGHLTKKSESENLYIKGQ